MGFNEPSGRELDAEVARHVFGFEVEQRRNKRTGEPDFVYRAGGNDSWLLVRHYSQTLAASITLENELNKRGWHRVRSLGGHEPAPGIEGTVTLKHTDGSLVEATGLLEGALCRATLRALGPLAETS